MIEFIFSLIAELFGLMLKVSTWIFAVEKILPDIGIVGGWIVSLLAIWAVNFIVTRSGRFKKIANAISTLLSSVVTIVLTSIFYKLGHITALELATIILAIIGIGLFATRKCIENWSDETYRNNAESCY